MLYPRQKACGAPISPFHPLLHPLLLHPLLLPGASFLTDLRLPAGISCISSPTQHPNLVSLPPSPSQCAQVFPQARLCSQLWGRDAGEMVLPGVWGGGLSTNSDRQEKASVGKEVSRQRCDTDEEPAAWMPDPCQGHLQRETGTKVKQTTGDPSHTTATRSRGV